MKSKFKRTKAETQRRPPMQKLPPTIGKDELTEKEIINALNKINSDRAVGPDEIPIEVFKSCEVSRGLLV